jgi:hypothetical protein
MKEGLRQGSYATPTESLTLLQAFLDLALSPERDLPDAVIRIDLVKMRRAGLDIPQTVGVARKSNLPGGGVDVLSL